MVVPTGQANRKLPCGTSGNGVMRLFVTTNPACDVFNWAAGIQKRLSATKAGLNDSIDENDTLKQALKTLKKSLGNYAKCVRKNAHQFSENSNAGMDSLKALVSVMDDRIKSMGEKLSKISGENVDIICAVEPVVAGSHEAL